MKLREWREKKGWTQLDLAVELAVSKATVSRIESGDQRPSLELVWKIFTVTGGRVRAQDFMERLN
jgi:transcriptional regulator with XRE-family HTH domain